jgi:nitrate reductase gamma subunit
MTTIAIILVYGIYLAFCVRFVLHALVWWRGVRQIPVQSRADGGITAKACIQAVGDAVFFVRLFRANPLLWIGEWTFHLSLLLVFLRHLRFVLEPVPAWIWSLQTAGLLAGYVLPFSLLYIIAVRLLTKREKYTSPANLFLLVLVLLISVAGILMHTVFRADVIGVKEFVRGIVTFKPEAMPGGIVFTIHFFLFLLIVPVLPTHIFTAPLVMMEARRREAGLERVLHDG